MTSTVLRGILPRMQITVHELAQRVDAEVRGDGELTLTGCATLETAGSHELSFLANPRYTDRLRASGAGAVVVSEKDAGEAEGATGRTLLVADDPYFVFRQAMILLHGWREQPAPGISTEAHIDEAAEVHELCTIRPFTYIAPRAKVGKRCIIYPNCYVGKDVYIGDDCTLYPGVVIYNGCVLGDRVTLHAGTVIGQDGFGYATHIRGNADAPIPDKATNATDDTGASSRSHAPALPPPPRTEQEHHEVIHHKLPPAGNVVIEDDVEMGANCSVDRATLGSTVIARGTKFSNGVTIGHGSQVGPHNLFVAQVGLAGSVRTGAYVAMGGQAGVAGHLTVGDQAQVAAHSGVMHDVPANTRFGGTPAAPLTEMKRVILHSHRLPDLTATVKRLERRVAELEAAQAVPQENP